MLIPIESFLAFKVNLIYWEKNLYFLLKISRIEVNVPKLLACLAITNFLIRKLLSHTRVNSAEEHPSFLVIVIDLTDLHYQFTNFTSLS